MLIRRRVTVQKQSLKRSAKLHDFLFPTGKGEQTSFQTERFLVKLSSRGGRIERLYLKNHAGIGIPSQAIKKMGDAFAIQNNAMEITLGNGMDFQPHLYYSGRQAEQLGKPALNQALFQIKKQSHNETLDISEVHYHLPFSFRGKRLELSKIYRFYPKENHFRQITVLRNLENSEFNFSFKQDGKQIYGALFFKPFGDLGPMEGEVSSVLGGSERFFYYNGELKRRVNSYRSSSGGCAGPLFGCTSLDKEGLYSNYVEAPNTLSLMGATSRYFFAYAEFLKPSNNALQAPDGFIYKNISSLYDKEAMTSVFKEFRLQPKQGGALYLGGAETLLDKEGKLKAKEFGNRSLIAKLQQERRDALIIDTKVFVGSRSENSHVFYDPLLTQAAFGQSKPNEEAQNVIYQSSYIAFFSNISNAIISIMRWLYGYIGNYGWCIIFIALAVKLATFPLNRMQIESMQRMSNLRPEIDALNKQYADNPQEKQKRMLQLFKKHNVNPAKGCLPVLIQMPIFVGLYTAFSSSIELWHSPFIFWMEDLSRPDTIWFIPYIDMNLNILPLLMVGSQILYQRATTVVTDTQQKVVMYLMPLIMLLFFWQIPSGVTLYWTVQNMISVVWQQLANFWKKYVVV